MKRGCKVLPTSFRYSDETEVMFFREIRDEFVFFGSLNPSLFQKNSFHYKEFGIWIPRPFLFFLDFGFVFESIRSN